MPKRKVQSTTVRRTQPATPQANTHKTLKQLQQALQNGKAEVDFPVGTEIPDRWKNVSMGITYEMPWIVVDYQSIETTGGELSKAAILLRKLIAPVYLVFGASRPMMCCAPYYKFKGVEVIKTEHTEYIKTVQELVYPTPSRVYWGPDVQSWLKKEYVEGCSQELLEVVTPVIIQETMVDDDYHSHIKEVDTRFFLPSCENLHLDIGNKVPLEQMTWQYFLDTPTDVTRPCSKRAFCFPRGSLTTTHSGYWLRTVDDRDVGMIPGMGDMKLLQREPLPWYINANDGSAHVEIANTILLPGILPACVIA